MQGRCDVCGVAASYRVQLVENGRQRGAVEALPLNVTRKRSF